MKRSFQPQPDCQPSSSKNVERKVRKRKADTLDLSIKIAKIEKDIRQKKIDQMKEESEETEDPLESVDKDENNNLKNEKD